MHTHNVLFHLYKIHCQSSFTKVYWSLGTGRHLQFHFSSIQSIPEAIQQAAPSAQAWLCATDYIFDTGHMVEATENKVI